MCTLISQALFCFNILLWKTSNPEKLNEPSMHLHLDSLVNILQHLCSLSLCRHTHSFLSWTIWEVVADIKTLHLEILQHVPPKKKDVSLYNPSTTKVTGVILPYRICIQISALVCKMTFPALTVFLMQDPVEEFSLDLSPFLELSFTGLLKFYVFHDLDSFDDPLS